MFGNDPKLIYQKFVKRKQTFKNMSSVKNSTALLKSLGFMKMAEQEENDNQSEVVELQDVTKDLFKTPEKGRNKRTFSDMLNGEKEQLAEVEKLSDAASQ